MTHKISTFTHARPALFVIYSRSVDLHSYNSVVFGEVGNFVML